MLKRTHDSWAYGFLARVMSGNAVSDQAVLYQIFLLVGQLPNVSDVASLSQIALKSHALKISLTSHVSELLRTRGTKVTDSKVDGL